MSNLSAETSKQWNIYSRTDPNQSQTEANRDGQWKNYGASVDAISFGFVATAILISMFLIMAIFEHLFKPTTQAFSSTPHTSSETERNLESTNLQKLANQETETSTYSLDFSVLMPGQRNPTFIAQPAPLPCRREGVYWPSHEHNFPTP